MGRTSLPIMVGRKLGKGMLAFRDMKMGGFNLCIVWLKGEHNSGDEYEMSDIRKFDAVIHFCDKESIRETIKVLEWILREWKEDGNGNDE